MWDPITVFSIMWLLNAKELPCQRLNVSDIIKDKEVVTLRQGT